MKILLIDPPFYRLMGFRNYGFPVGLAMLGALLESRGHEVRIQDADFTGEAPRTNPEYLTSFYPTYLEAVRDEANPVWREIEEVVGQFDPDLVGVGIMTPKLASAIRVIEAARRASPRATIVAGGPHPTLRAEELLAASPDLDCAVRGDGFSTLPEIARTVAEGGARPARVIDGDPTAVPFDSLPSPARHLLAHRASYSSEELGVLTTSMGCPRRCTFCSTHAIWKKGQHMRSAEKVVAEMLEVHREHGVRAFSILDDVFTFPRERAVEVCQRLLAARIPVTWTCGTHVNLIDRDLVRLMREAGCYKVAIGVESGSERVLRTIRKGMVPDKVREAKRILDREGMLWTGYFLIGILDETAEEMRETVAFMRELAPPFASLGVYENYPGTALFEQGIEMGLTEPHLTRADLFDLAPNQYYFRNGRRRVASLEPAEYEKVVSEVMRAFHAHNHSARTLARRAWRKRADYLKSPGHFWKDVRRLWGKFRIARPRAA